MGVFLKYFERLSYLLSQGTLRLRRGGRSIRSRRSRPGSTARRRRQVAFDTARALMAAGINFEFVDADSLARATVRDGRLEVADSSYRALIFPAMEAVRWPSLEKAGAFAKAGGLVLSVGALPFASDRAGRDDKELDALVAATFAEKNRLAKPADVPPVILGAFTPDTRADKPGALAPPQDRARATSTWSWTRRRTRPSSSAPKAGSSCGTRGPATTRPLRVLGETATGTKVEMPLEDYEAQIVVFSPGEPHVNGRIHNRNIQLSNRPGRRMGVRAEADDGQPLRRFPPAGHRQDHRPRSPHLPPCRRKRRRGGVARRRTSTTADGSGSPTASARSSGCWGRFPADAPEAELAKLTRVNPQDAGHRRRQAVSLAALQFLLAPRTRRRSRPPGLARLEGERHRPFPLPRQTRRGAQRDQV